MAYVVANDTTPAKYLVLALDGSWSEVADKTQATQMDIAEAWCVAVTAPAVQKTTEKFHIEQVP